eukprot:52624-Chlamydomonas_euryale.AAC.1
MPGWFQVLLDGLLHALPAAPVFSPLPPALYTPQATTLPLLPQGVVLADYDTAMPAYFRSELDTGAYVDAQPIVGAAVVLARMLHAQASPTPSVPLVVGVERRPKACIVDLVGLLVGSFCQSCSRHCLQTQSAVQ